MPVQSYNLRRYGKQLNEKGRQGRIFLYNHWYKEVKKEAYVRNTGKETIKPREGVEFRASNHRLLIVLKPIRNCCLPIVCQLI